MATTEAQQCATGSNSTICPSGADRLLRLVPAYVIGLHILSCLYLQSVTTTHWVKRKASSVSATFWVYGTHCEICPICPRSLGCCYKVLDVFQLEVVPISHLGTGLQQVQKSVHLSKTLGFTPLRQSPSNSRGITLETLRKVDD